MDMVNYKKPSKEQKYNLKSNMKTRCYNENYHKVKPDYEECTVCDEWLDNKKLFYEWVDHNFYEIEVNQQWNWIRTFWFREIKYTVLIPVSSCRSGSMIFFSVCTYSWKKKEWTTDRSNLFKEDRKVSGYGQRKLQR